MRLVVTGTDTDIGKTVFAAALAGALDGFYWKPIQAGLDEETDCETVLRLSGLPQDRLLPEAYRLKTPASPHLAAKIDGLVINPNALALPDVARPLVVEGAGGLMVPLTESITYIDVMARWRVPMLLLRSVRWVSGKMQAQYAMRSPRMMTPPSCTALFGKKMVSSISDVTSQSTLMPDSTVS